MQTSGTVSYAPPVCPLTPLAAPVAVKKTIASRRSWMLACSAAFSSPNNCFFVGSKERLRRCQGYIECIHWAKSARFLKFGEVDGETIGHNGLE